MNKHTPTEAAIKFALEYWYGALAAPGDESDPRVISLATAYDLAIAAERERFASLFEQARAAQVLLADLSINPDPSISIVTMFARCRQVESQLRSALTALSTSEADHDLS